MYWDNPSAMFWICLAAVIPVAWWLSLVDAPRLRRYAASACRIAAIVCVVLMIARPNSTRVSDAVHTIHLIDTSASIDVKGLETALEGITISQQKMRPQDSSRILRIEASTSPATLAALRTAVELRKTVPSDPQKTGATRLAQALGACRGAFPAAAARRLVIWSDGVGTDGELRTILNQLRAEGVSVSLNPIAKLSRPEAGVTAFTAAHKSAYQGEVMRFTARLSANQAMKAKVRLVHQGVVLQEKTTELKAEGETRLEFDNTLLTTGAARFGVEIIPEHDYFAVNNRLDTTVNVRGKPRILILHKKETALRGFARALRQQDLDVEVRGEHGLPESLPDLLAFDAVVLSNIPATAMDERQLLSLKRYVTDFGGGLAMFGGDNTYGLGGYYRTPVEEVLPLTSRYEKEREKPSLAMVMVMDKSGSMDGLPIELSRQAAKSAVELMAKRDQVGVVAFDSEARIICPLTQASDTPSITAAIDSLEAGGGTFMYPGMQLAQEMLSGISAQLKHVLILSDGMSQEADHIGLAQIMADAGITVSTIAMGDDADRALLSRMAEIGKGRYYETNDPSNVPQIFTKETVEASRSAVKEDIFSCTISGDHPLVAGRAGSDLPVILGYVLTESKPTAQVLITLPTQDPLLAIGRYGLGQSLAYTSDLTERWGAEWLGWDGCGRFWAQALRAIARRDNANGLEVTQHLDRKNWNLGLRYTDIAGRSLDQVQWDAAVLDEGGSLTRPNIFQVGLGRYSLSLDLTGSQRVALRLADPARDTRVTMTHETPFPAEYLLSKEPDPALAACPPCQPGQEREGLKPATAPKRLDGWFGLAALIFLVAGLIIRRL